MAQFSVKTARFDPYRNFKFKIKWSVDRASLGEAKLWNADLRGANLEGAILDGAYPRASQRLTTPSEQLCKAKTLYVAQLDSELREVVKKECPELLEKPQ